MIFDDDNSNSTAKFPGEKNAGSINWKIYPNPVGDSKCVTVANQTTRRSAVELKLFSIRGTLISSKSINNDEPGYFTYRISTENLSRGTYYISIRLNDYMESKLLLIP
jgi:hypothetical protein